MTDLCTVLADPPMIVRHQIRGMGGRRKGNRGAGSGMHVRDAIIMLPKHGIVLFSSAPKKA